MSNFEKKRQGLIAKIRFWEKLLQSYPNNKPYHRTLDVLRKQLAELSSTIGKNPRV